MFRRRNTSAFTLVELLVVIAIIGVLVSLLLPAVNAAREAARRTQCMNGTRQIGLAILNHESALSIFPSGGTVPWPNIEDYSSNGRPFGAEKQGLSWAFQILPYLEEGAISNLTTTKQIAESPVSLYFCPSRRSPTFITAEVLNAPNGSYGAWLMDYASLQPMHLPPAITQARLDQLLNNNFACRAGYGFWGRSAASPGGMDFNPKSCGELGAQCHGFKGVIVRTNQWVQANGVVKDLGFDSVTKVRKIKDGLSKTGMIAEKWVKIRDYSRTYAPDDDRGWSDGWDIDTVKLAICPPLADSKNSPPALGYSSFASLGSAHTAGFNCVYADGAVHFINYNIAPLTMNYIAHRADGQLINENE